MKIVAKWKKISLLVFPVILAMVISGTGLAGDTPKYGGILRVAEPVDAIGLDPHIETVYASQMIIEHIYSGLVRYDDKLNVVPDLAESWEISDDSLTYTFHLRKGIKFHNDQELTSEDVKFSIERIVDPKTGSIRSYYFSPIASIETPDKWTVKFHFDKPFAPFLAYLADPWTAIVSKKVVEENGNLQKVAIGTGPFKLKERVVGDHTLLEKNPDYYDKSLPYLDGLRFQIIPEANSRAAAMRTKQIEYTSIMGDMQIMENVKDVELVKMPSLTWGWIWFNCERPPFDNPEVRLAIAYAIDRQELVDTALLEYGTPTGILPKALGDWAVDMADLPGYEGQNYEKAEALLEEAGYPDGFKATFKTSTAYPDYLPAAQTIQAQLKPLGIEIEIIPLEWGTFISDIVKRDFDINYLTFPGYTSDPDAYFINFLITGGASNLAGFSDEIVDRLLEEGRTTMEHKARKGIYDKLQHRLAELAPVVYTYSYTAGYAKQPYVKGFKLNPILSKIYFREIWLDK